MLGVIKIVCFLSFYVVLGIVMRGLLCIYLFNFFSSLFFVIKVRFIDGDVEVFRC